MLSSPLTSSLSPVGNLTGIPRKVRDNCADLYNSVQRWNALQIDGSQKLREIIDTCTQRAMASELSTNVVKTFSPDLQAQCTDLLKIVENLRAIHKKMELLVHQFKSLVALADVQSSFDHLKSPVSDQSPTAAVFHTWSLKDFARASASLVDAYSLDYHLKFDIAQSVAHINSDDNKRAKVGIFLLAAWLHQPHVSDIVALQLEAMTVECRLRQ